MSIGKFTKIFYNYKRWKESIQGKQETIERVFGDGKRKHGLDYTLYTDMKEYMIINFLCSRGINTKKLCTYCKKQKDKCVQNMNFEHQNESVLLTLGLK